MNEPYIETVEGPLTLEGALDSDLDNIPLLTSFVQSNEFRYGRLEARRSEIQILVSQHLHISPEKIGLSQPSQWIQGGFNVCLPIDILDDRSGRLPRKVILRFAVPHAIGEVHAPGSVDEKVRCEAATYVWLERECPTIPIPRMLGVGLPGAKSVCVTSLIALPYSLTTTSA